MNQHQRKKSTLVPILAVHPALAHAAVREYYELFQQLTPQQAEATFWLFHKAPEPLTRGYVERVIAKALGMHPRTG